MSKKINIKKTVNSIKCKTNLAKFCLFFLSKQFERSVSK